jgi:2-keto-3-deoxy-6-phosphogluconate aldolase
MRKIKINLMLKTFLVVVVGFCFGTAEAQTWSTITTATASDASANSYFGSAVAIDGDYAAIRAVGAIYVFKRNQTTYAWTQQQKLTLPGSYNYGNGSVAISGNYVAAIGGSSTSDGSLYIFKRDSTSDTWAQQQVLTASDASGFSGAVSISGNYVVAGATTESEDANGSNTLTNAGAVYVYELSSGIWSEQQKLVAASRAASAIFGNSLGISGNYIIVNSGDVFKLDPDLDIWNLKQSLGGGASTYVCITSNKIFIEGCYCSTVNNGYWSYSPHVWYDVYLTTGSFEITEYGINSSNLWTVQGSITKTATYSDSYSSNYQFPFYLFSANGNYLFFNFNGITYLYEKTTEEGWIQLQTFTQKSKPLSLSFEDIAIGDNSSNSNAGSVSFYKMSSYATLSATTASVGSSDGCSSSTNLIYNTPFTATSNQSWLTVSPSSISPVVCSDTSKLTFTAKANPTSSPRSAKVTIAATGVSNQYVIVTQKAMPAITWGQPDDITYGTTLSTAQLNATASVEGTFTYTPDLESGLDVGDNQTLRVDFIPKDTSSYEKTYKTVTINVKKAVPSLTWATPSDIVYGTALGSKQLNATSDILGTYVYTPASGTKLGTGKMQKLQVTFTPVDTQNYAVTTKTVNINVTKAAPVLTWATPSDLVCGNPLSGTQLNATATVDGLFVYTPTAGTVLSLGNTQLLKTSFTPTDTANYKTVSDSVYINIVKGNCTVSTNSLQIGTQGNTTTFNINSNTNWQVTTSASWLSIDPSTGTGNSSIALKAQSNTSGIARSTTVTVTASGLSPINISVTQKAIPVITWATPSAITYGTALSATQLNATAPIGGSFVYSPALNTILKAGTQTLNVTFRPNDTANYAVATQSVQLQVNKATPSVTWATPAGITYGTTLGSSQLNATSTVNGIFSYAPVAGTLLNAGNSQKLTVSFTPSDTVNYEKVNKTVYINVSKANPVVSWTTPSDIIIGTALSSDQLNATANIDGSFTYTPAAGTILNAGKNQSIEVLFTPTNNSNYAEVSKTVYINVNKKAPVLSWTTPSDIIYGTTLSNIQLNATSNMKGAFVYTPSAGTILHGGLQTLRASFTPEDSNYDTVAITVKIRVKKATPEVKWENPSDIGNGTALSSTQLNATASINGTFIYSPSYNTVMKTGNDQTLSVCFKPSDSTDYEEVNKTVVINVIAATFAISKTALNLEAQIDTVGYVTISSNTSWLAVSDQKWLSISPSSGSGNGTLSLVASTNKSTARTAIVTVSATGFDSQTIIVTQAGGATAILAIKNNISIYPNPVSNILNISNISSNALISIYNLNGQMVLSKTINGNSLSISQLPAGMYTLRITESDKCKTLKFVKK